MRATATLAAALFTLAFAPSVSAQLSLSFRFSFVDTQSGGNGNIGVCQDEVQGHFFVIDFSNALTIHEFDPAGNFLTQFTTTSCSPAAPSPNDIAYDPINDLLWVVDNGPTVVVPLNRAGACQAGWGIAPPTGNPAGLAFNRNTGTLLVGSTGLISEWSVQGAPLTGGFAFTPPSGSAYLNGIAHVPSNDHVLVAQSGGTEVFEFDASGTLLSTTSLAGFGLVNIQGLAFNASNQTLLVVDNATSTVHVFDAAFCRGTTRSSGSGCRDAGGTALRLTTAGCPDRRAGFSIGLATSASNVSPFFLIFGLSDTNTSGIALPLDLGLFGAPGCSLYTSQEGVIGPLPNVGGGGSLALTLPNDPTLTGGISHWQAFQFGPPIATPLPLISSDYLTLTIG
ncbi:MAG: hypothetical protein JNM84_03515 [Planctomycetes bacterium]|nr:hypothetical protein [Planctomycetota bacterium]